MSYKFNPFTGNFDEVNDTVGGITQLTGDVTAGPGSGSQAATIANDSVTNAKLANMATQTIKGRTTAGSGDPEDLTAAQATAILDVMVGDSGSGGTKGLVPAASAGDTAANKFLKADGTFKAVDDLNFIGSADRDAEVSVGSWAAYADAAAATPVDMTGGSPNTTITRTTTSGEVLRGTGSFKLTKSSGASRQGEGVSVAFTVPPSAQGKLCTIKFPYRVTSGTVVEGDFKVFVYDSTNSVLITPFANDLVGQTGTMYAQFSATPSAGTPANQTYRVGIHIASSTDSAVSISFDDIQVVEEELSFGAVATGWVNAGTNTFSATTTAPTKGTTTVDKIWWKREGDTMACRMEYRQTGAGTAGSGDYLIAIPSGYSIDTTKVTAYNTVEGWNNTFQNNNNVGTVQGGNGSNQFFGQVVVYDSIYVRFAAEDGSSNAQGFIGSAGYPLSGASQYYVAEFRVPILGWQASNAISASQQFLISNYLVTGSRVTSTPTALGQYRTYQKTSSSFAGTDNAPTNGPSAADGMRIYSVNYASAGTAGQTNRWEIFVGQNKVPKLLTYANAGRTGHIYTEFNVGGTNTYGIDWAYDPVTGVVTVDTMSQTTSTTSRYVGIVLPTAGGAYTQPSDCYFDILVSEKVNSVQFDVPNSYIHLDSGNGHGSTNTKIRRFSNTRASVGTDITYADSATNGASFTINTAGIYQVEYYDVNTVGTTIMGISVNTSSATTSISSLTYAQGKRAQASNSSVGTCTATATLRLSPGDVVRAHTDGSTNNTNDNVIFLITRIA